MLVRRAILVYNFANLFTVSFNRKQLGFRNCPCIRSVGDVPSHVSLWETITLSPEEILGFQESLDHTLRVTDLMDIVKGN